MQEHATKTAVAESMPTAGRLSKAQVSIDPYRVDPGFALPRDDRGFHTRSVYDYRTLNADDLLQLLSKYDPDVSAGIWNFLRLANSGLVVRALDYKRRPSAKGQVILEAMLARLAGLEDYNTWTLSRSLESIASQQLKYVLLRGACGFELVLNNLRQASRFETVDPVKVQFTHEGPGVYKPFQYDLNGAKVPLDIPTFFWNVLDPDAGSPYETPPFLPVIQAVMFNLSVMQDLQKIVKRVAYPRISIKIVEETLRKFAPISVQTDETAMANWLNSQKEQIASGLSQLNPEDAAVFFDSMSIDILETKANATVDFRPLKEVIDQRIITGLKSLPTILGRQFGSSQTLSGVESLLYAKSISSLQQVVTDSLSRALTLALRLEGFLGYVVLKYKPVTLKPDHELEAFYSLKQARVLELLSFGFYTDEEAAEELTGSSTLPDSFTALSGTRFYEKKGAVDAGAIIATRNPTASEQAGGGRNRT